MQYKPKVPNPHITPSMIANARVCLGACNQFDAKYAQFESAGRTFPDEKEYNDMLRKKGQGVIAAASMLYDFPDDNNKMTNESMQ